MAVCGVPGRAKEKICDVIPLNGYIVWGCRELKWKFTLSPGQARDNRKKGGIEFEKEQARFLTLLSAEEENCGYS